MTLSVPPPAPLAQTAAPVTLAPTTAPAKPGPSLTNIGPCIAVGIILFLVVGGGVFWRLLKLDLREQKARQGASAVSAEATPGGERSLPISAAVVAVLAVGALVVGIVLLTLIVINR